MKEIKLEKTTFIYGTIVLLLILGGYVALRLPLNSTLVGLLSVKAEEAPDQVESVTVKLPSFLIKASYTDGITRRAVINTIIPNRTKTNVSVYEVNHGDNLFLIADKFNLKPETVLWGNYDVMQENPNFFNLGRNCLSCL